jgi:hypothetical protein
MQLQMQNFVTDEINLNFLDIIDFKYINLLKNSFKSSCKSNSFTNAKEKNKKFSNYKTCTVPKILSCE